MDKTRFLRFLIIIKEGIRQPITNLKAIEHDVTYKMLARVEMVTRVRVYYHTT